MKVDKQQSLELCGLNVNDRKKKRITWTWNSSAFTSPNYICL